MRQDPDIILIGEVRDQETAQMALRAAMTGHRVFSTLHTNSALGAIPRLFDLGIQPDVLAGNLTGVIAQRLVRRLCQHCKQAYLIMDMERMLTGIGHGDQKMIYRATGCVSCAKTGYQGRMAIMEIFNIDEVADEIIARRGSRNELLRHAVAAGFRTLARAGVTRILDGTTSVDEVARVIDLAREKTRTADHAYLSLPGH
jgi:type II secretory ATPase GspE/PulE/Tfp pilus assembly ATPase PilB-like protein